MVGEPGVGSRVGWDGCQFRAIIRPRCQPVLSWEKCQSCGGTQAMDDLKIDKNQKIFNEQIWSILDKLVKEDQLKKVLLKKH